MSINRSNTRGVLYVATGLDYIKDAFKSARSVRKTNPLLPIHLFGDFQNYNLSLDVNASPFTSWENIVDPHPRSKVDYISRTPFQETLFLDTDTRVLCDLTEAFDLLKQFDIALPHSPKREIVHKKKFKMIEMPRAFPEFNSGIIFFRSTPKTAEVFVRWRQRFLEIRSKRDQPALREVLWSSDLRIATLPPEYNVRFIKYILMWSKDEARPKILHLTYYRQGFMYYVRFWGKRF